MDALVLIPDVRVDEQRGSYCGKVLESDNGLSFQKSRIKGKGKLNGSILLRRREAFSALISSLQRLSGLPVSLFMRTPDTVYSFPGMRLW